MSLRGILPYLLIFAAIVIYLWYRMQTVEKTPRRPSDWAQPPVRGRARRWLRVTGSWDELGHHKKEDGKKTGK